MEAKARARIHAMTRRRRWPSLGGSVMSLLGRYWPLTNVVPLSPGGGRKKVRQIDVTVR